MAVETGGARTGDPGPGLKAGGRGKDVLGATGKHLRVCPKGHKFHKTSDCPTCPKCEAGKKPASGFLSELSAPARRALVNEGITTPGKLAKYSLEEILRLHGMGPRSIPILKKALRSEGMAFRA